MDLSALVVYHTNTEYGRFDWRSVHISRQLIVFQVLLDFATHPIQVLPLVCVYHSITAEIFLIYNLILYQVGRVSDMNLTILFPAQISNIFSTASDTHIIFYSMAKAYQMGGKLIDVVCDFSKNVSQINYIESDKSNRFTFC